MTQRAITEVSNYIEMLRAKFGWKDIELDLIKSMMESLYLTGTIDGYKEGSDITFKIVERAYNGK